MASVTFCKFANERFLNAFLTLCLAGVMIELRNCRRFSGAGLDATIDCPCIPFYYLGDPSARCDESSDEIYACFRAACDWAPWGASCDGAGSCSELPPSFTCVLLIETPRRLK